MMNPVIFKDSCVNTTNFEHGIFQRDRLKNTSEQSNCSTETKETELTAYQSNEQFFEDVATFNALCRHLHYDGD